MFWGLTKNTEKYFYHLGFLPSNRIQRLTHKHSKTRVFSSPINTQKHVFLGLTKNTEKHFYHLRQGRAIHNTQYKYNTIQYNSPTIRINTQYTKCLEGNTCIIKSLSKKLFLTILNPQNWENLHRLFWFPIANFAIDRAWSN